MKRSLYETVRGGAQNSLQNHFLKNILLYHFFLKLDKVAAM